MSNGIPIVPASGAVEIAHLSPDAYRALMKMLVNKKIASLTTVEVAPNVFEHHYELLPPSNFVNAENQEGGDNGR